MKISKGPTLMRFADQFGWDADEVLDWVTTYVNNPKDNFPVYEGTEKERFESIKKYIEMRLSNTSDARVKEIVKRKTA